MKIELILVMKLWLLISGCLSARDRRDADTSLGEAEKLCKNFYEGTRFYKFIFSYALGRFFNLSLKQFS